MIQCDWAPCPCHVPPRIITRPHHHPNIQQTTTISYPLLLHHLSSLFQWDPPTCEPHHHHPPFLLHHFFCFLLLLLYFNLISPYTRFVCLWGLIGLGWMAVYVFEGWIVLLITSRVWMVDEWGPQTRALSVWAPLTVASTLDKDPPYIQPSNSIGPNLNMILTSFSIFIVHNISIFTYIKKA